jgi:hypothetical protein
MHEIREKTKLSTFSKINLLLFKGYVFLTYQTGDSGLNVRVSP